MAMVAVLDGVRVESGVMHQPGFGELATGELGTGGQCP
jgi:hypothetical protein